MNSNGIISAPVNTDDVRAVINENSHDVGTLCMSLKINGKSKHKPIGGSSPGTVSDANRKAVNYGITVPSYTNAVTMAKAVYALTADDVEFKFDSTFFRYNRPGSNDFKRLDDFVGYNHNCKMPAEPIEQSTIIMPSDKTVGYGVTFLLVSGITDNIELKDLVSDPSLYYLGIAVTNNSSIWGVTQAYPITDTSHQAIGYVRMVFNGLLANGSYRTFAFLSPQKIDSFQLISAKSGTWIPLTFTRKTVQFTLAAKELTLSLYVWQSSSNTKQLQFSYTIKNTSATEAASIQGVKITAYNSSNAEVASTQVNTPVLLNPGQSKTQTGLLTCQSMAMRNSAKTATMVVTEATTSWTRNATITTSPPPEA